MPPSPNLAPHRPLPPNAKIIWQPQPGPQTALVSCPVFEVFFGGARFGGKTDGSLGDWILHSSIYGSDAVGVFIRRKAKDLHECIQRAKELFFPLGAKWNGTDREFTMPGGGRLKFSYCERDDDAEQYQGGSYTRIYIEEAGQFPSISPINKIRGACRSAKGVPCGMRLTGNPGGPGQHWIKERYIDPCPAGYKVITETDTVVVDGELIEVKIDRVFIPSKIYDNKIGLRNDPSYVLRLKQTGSEALVRAWLDGDWEAVEGAYFDEWTPTKHVLHRSWLHKIPDHAMRFRSFDWGHAKPFSVGWWAVSDGTWGLPAGALLRYREWYGMKSANVGLRMQNDLIALGILEREKGERISYGVADPSIFKRDGGPSIAEQMLLKGCAWRPADNSRIAGWGQCRSRLKGEDGLPMVYVLDTCVDLIRTLPMMQHDENHPEDLDSEGEDHAVDEMRYGLMSRPYVKRAPPSQEFVPPKTPAQMTFQEIVQINRRRRLAKED